jgi:hypothetical protein
MVRIHRRAPLGALALPAIAQAQGNAIRLYAVARRRSHS